MEQNPYTTPQVGLIDESVRRSLPGWTPGHLKLLGWLCLVSLLGTLALLTTPFVVGEEDKTLKGFVNGFGLALTLLSSYLLVRLKSFAEARFDASGLAWPVWSTVLASLLVAASDLLFDLSETAFSDFTWQTLVYFALLALYGAVVAWLGIRLLKVQNVYPVFKTMAWLNIVGGIMSATVILLVLAVLPLLGAMVAMMLVFFKGAVEASAKPQS